MLEYPQRQGSGLSWVWGLPREEVGTLTAAAPRRVASLTELQGLSPRAHAGLVRLVASALRLPLREEGQAA